MSKIIVTRHPATVAFIASTIVEELNAEARTKGWHECAAVEAILPSLVRLLVGWAHPTTGLVAMCQDGTETPLYVEIPVLASATADDVLGKIVYGNLPLALASLAAEVRAVEFTGPPPRGQEYGVEDMRKAGATIRSYRVMESNRFAEKCRELVQEAMGYSV